jgi:two-component system nitrate/nitrite response regulator NarL
MKPIRVLLADDHSLFRKGLAGLLGREKRFQIVGEAEDGVEALTKAKELKPDIVLMDISMPGGNGIEATRRIRQALPSTRVVILTFLEEDKRLFDAIKAGAHGYLLKNVRPEALFKTLIGIMRGEAAISRNTAAKILHEFAEQSLQRYTEPDHEPLSERELEVLRLVTAGTTNKQISHKLHIAENTVKNHLKAILNKLHVENRVQAATFALDKGIVAKKFQGE